MESLPDINGALLDPEQILMLIETGDEEAADLLCELAELYESECEAKLAEFREALAVGNSNSLSKIAHAIAGSSANIGARKTWEIAKRIEERCKKGEIDAAAADIESLEQIYSLSLKELGAVVAQLRGQ